MGHNSFTLKHPFLFILILLGTIRFAFSQNGLIKSINQFDGRIGQHVYLNNMFIFSENNSSNNSAGNRMWFYHLDTKEIGLISKNVDYYGEGFYTFQDNILFNQNGYLVIYNTLNNKIDTISNEYQSFGSTELQNAISINENIFFNDGDFLWQLNSITYELVALGGYGKIIESSINHIFLRSNKVLSCFNITTKEWKVIIQLGSYEEFVKYEVIGEDLIFQYRDKSSISDAYLFKYETSSDMLSDLDVIVRHYNTVLYHNIFIKTNDGSKLIYYDGQQDNLFWIYENGSNSLHKVKPEDNYGADLSVQGRFIQISNSLYFGGWHSKYGNSLIEFNIEKEKFDHIVTFPDGTQTYDMDYGESNRHDFRLHNGRIIAQLYSNQYSDPARHIVSIDPESKSLEIIKTLPFNNGLYEIFQNSIVYDEPQKGSGASHILWRYSFDNGTYDTIKGSYFIDENSYTWAWRLTQYQNKFLFLWDNRNRLLSIDDSYKDSTLVVESCKSYTILNESLTASGSYRKKISSDTIDIVINLELTINNIESGIYTGYQSGSEYLGAFENNADMYQWIRCKDFETIEGATSKTYSAMDYDYYGVIIQKGSCIDTLGCDVVLGLDYIEENITVFPNPSSSIVNLNGLNCNSECIEVFNLSGQKIAFTIIEYQEGTLSIKIDKKGLNIIRVSEKGKYHYFKVFID